MTRIDLPDVKVGRSTVLRVEGRLLLICRSLSGWSATDAHCPHQRRIMDGARVIADQVVCPWHGARFSLAGGVSASPELTTNGLRVYACEETESGLLITLD